jgi:hypothetical protein
MGLFDSLFERFKSGTAKESATPTNAVTATKGATVVEAIVIKAKTEREAVAEEYEYLSQTYGPRGVGWTLNRQALISEKSGSYDVLDITLSDGTQHFIYFDINSFYGKKS